MPLGHLGHGAVGPSYMRCGYEYYEYCNCVYCKEHDEATAPWLKVHRALTGVAPLKQASISTRACLGVVR